MAILEASRTGENGASQVSAERLKRACARTAGNARKHSDHYTWVAGYRFEGL